MPEPPAWPGGAPPEATKWYAQGVWLLIGTPPAPWPFEPDTGFPPETFGPVGTRWWVPESGIDQLISELGEDAIRAALRKLALFRSPTSAGYQEWRVPIPPAQPAEPVRAGMRYARISIVGKLDADEEVVHTLSLRTAPVPDVDQDEAAIQTLANQVRDIWRNWLYAPIAGRDAPRAYMPGNLSYTEVRAAYVQLPGPGRRVLHGQGTKSEHIVYEYDKPTYLVDTQYAPFPDPTRGGASVALPYEVAMVMSLDSGRRGPANRGRMYLGPLSATVMAANGKFQAQAVQDLVSSFATGVIGAINATTGCDVHIASRYWNDSIPVASVRAGHVPDSQRRRRRGQNELYTASIATPLQPA